MHGMLVEADSRPKNMLRMALNSDYYPKMRQPTLENHLGMTTILGFMEHR